MGGVAHKPWRAVEAEKILTGAPATAAIFQQAAEATMRQARGYEHNRFKIEMGKRAIVQALTIVVDAGVA
jgi:xanthine dehydrogenase YagS FAD-binding subunit